MNGTNKSLFGRSSTLRIPLNTQCSERICDHKLVFVVVITRASVKLLICCVVDVAGFNFILGSIFIFRCFYTW